MKKIKYLLLILTVLFIPKVYASANTYERTKENNYGVNKHWDMTEERIEYAKETPLVDANELIYDFSDILTDEEEEKYYEMFKEFKEEYNIDIVFLSYNLPYHVDSVNEDFATDFYDFNDFGIDFKSYSGVLLFRNTYEQDPYYDMYSFGEAQLYFNHDRMSNILDDLYVFIHNGRYDNALHRWLRELKTYYNKGKIKGYHVDENSYLVKDFNPLIGPILITDIIITAIFIGFKIKKNKMVHKATNADLYLNNESFKLLEKTDNLIATHTTSWTETESSGGHSGGGGSHSSGGHSGGGHSSGGGRHG